MAYKQYTHDRIIQNSNLIIKNAYIDDKYKILHDIGEVNNNANRANFSILVPGFINLHGHLAYTNLKIKPQNLFNWMGDLLENLKHLDQVNTTNWAYEASLNACKEMQLSGTRFIIENSNFPLESLRAMNERNLEGIIGIEVFGSDPEKAKNIFAEKIKLIESLNQINKNPKIQITLSPHASYDVSIPLWRLCQEWCDRNKVPLLSHIAESKEEEEWFQTQNAPSAKQFWTRIGTLDYKLKYWKPYRSSVDWLDKNGLLSSNSILAHAVHANQEDLEILQRNGVKLITCPRSNLFLNNGLAKYKIWNELNIIYGIGTDSKASNLDLDLRKEVNAIPGLTAKQRFELITNKAASILNRNDLGIIQNGIKSSYIELEIPKDKIDLNSMDIFELIMNTELCKIKQE